MKIQAVIPWLLSAASIACADDAASQFVVDKSAIVDDAGAFRIRLQNPTARDVEIDGLASSCPCVTFQEKPAVLQRAGTAEIVGFVDRAIAPESLGVAFMANGVRHYVRVHVPGSKPRWNKGVIYRTDARPGCDLGEVAGVYIKGPRSVVEVKLSKLRVNASGVAKYSWDRLRPVEDSENYWYAGLQMELAADAGPEPVTGVVELEGARIRLALVFGERAD